MVASTRALDRVFSRENECLSRDPQASHLFDAGSWEAFFIGESKFHLFLVVFKMFRLCRVTPSQLPDVGTQGVGSSILRVPGGHVTVEFESHFNFLDFLVL